MAKNLKLNIKNAQLAEALKLNVPKKKASEENKEKKPAPKEAPAPKKAAEPKAPMAESKLVEKPVAPPTVEKKPEQPAQAKPAPVAPKPEVEAKPEAPKAPARNKPEAPKAPARKMLPGFDKRDHEHRFGPRRTFDRNASPRESQGAPKPQSGDRNSRFGPRGASTERRSPSAPGQRPPFRREGGTDTRPGPARRPMNTPRDTTPKEVPQAQPHKRPSPSGTDFSRKAPPGREIKPTKRPTFNKSFDSRDRQGLRSHDDERWRKKRNFKSKHQVVEEVIRPKELTVRLPITIKDLASEMKLKASELVAKLFMQGVIVTLNDYLDDETTIQLLGHEFECEITIDTSEEERLRITDKTIKEEIADNKDEELVLRPPVVAFMGHVDHGKTSLIDAIRKANIAATEAGDITQHIGAFTCHTNIGQLTILDTPGHEAFSAMRERGADVTDIVVLVVAGDEGIKPQTLEAIEQAQKANVPMIVAMNKSDKPNFNPEDIYRQLADRNLLPEAWGGSVITVSCSAKTGEGVKDLLEMLALQSEILELKANPSSRARGSVIESELHKGLGTVATLLVQNGTLKVGDALVFDRYYARVKTMHDEHSKELKVAGPSIPVKITGLSGCPEAGSEFIVVKDEKEAKDISEKRAAGRKMVNLLQKKNPSLENLLQDKAASASKKTVNIVLKADVQGSLEALKNSLRKLPSSKVELNFVSEGVGEISESDIQFASTSKAVILGFHTKVESHAEGLIKQTKAEIYLYDIIYHAVDAIKKVMLASLDKVAQEEERGQAMVKAVFKSSQLGNIAGCQVTEGTIKRNHHARLVRGQEVLWKGPIASLKRMQDDAKEVQKGYECGILLLGFSDFKEEDTIQAYEITYLQQDLE